LIITKIQRIRGNRSRYSVQLDGSPALELSDWTIGRFALRTGDDLDQRKIDMIKSAEAEICAKNIAINYLSYRPRSTKEITDHLIKKGFEQECAEGVAKHLHSLNMIDDRKFAYSFIRDRLKRKPTGIALLRKQLLSKGIVPSTTDAVLAELVSSQSQQQSALLAAKRKIQVTQRSKKNIDSEKRKKRVLDFLLRRGFTYEVALKTIRTTLDQ
jgi:regulatory protein